MEDTIIYNSNVAYHVCRGEAKQQHETDHRRETVPTEDSDEAVHTEFTTVNQQLNNDNHSSRELKNDNLSIALIKIKNLLIVIILLVAALVVTTLTAMTLSVLTYISQPNGNSINIQKNLDILQTQLYCGAGEWHRIALLNMTDSSQQCPPAWREYNTSGIRACGRAYSIQGNCSSVAYMAKSVYRRVCGQVIGYQLGSPDAFRRQPLNPNNIDMDGINITLGTHHRQHIWSFVAGTTENSSAHTQSNCPCSFTSGTASPSHVGNNY